MQKRERVVIQEKDYEKETEKNGNMSIGYLKGMSVGKNGEMAGREWKIQRG